MLMTIAAISTVAVALFLFGGLAYVYLGVSGYANDLSGKYEIQAYFKDGSTYSEIKSTAETLRKRDGIKTVVWIPRDKAWEKERRENPELTAGIENPFPDALKITVSDVKGTNTVVAAIKAMPQIQPDQVMYHDPTQRFLTDVLKLIQWLGVVLGGLLLTTAGILIYNAIRLTIDARKREIRIMQLVGASHVTVRVPFLIEGAVQGLAGGMIATLLLWGAHTGVEWYIVNNLTALEARAKFPLESTASILGAIGALYGIVCSTLAIRGPSRLRTKGI
jgi:cell division transport system permease protein